MNKKLFTLGLLVILFIGGFSIFAALDRTPDHEKVNLSGEIYTTHDPIWIDGNDEFLEGNGVVSGSGTRNDPYIVGGWGIKDGGITISSTTAFFVIKNCFIIGGEAGISFLNVVNGKISDTIICNCTGGIFLVTPQIISFLTPKYIITKIWESSLGIPLLTPYETARFTIIQAKASTFLNPSLRR
jgi:hypothetical protein